MMREQQNQGTPFGIGLRRRSNNLSTGSRGCGYLPKKIGGDDLEPACLICSNVGKLELERGPPLPPLERLDWRGFRKNGLQNLESQWFAGQNLENTGVMG